MTKFELDPLSQFKQAPDFERAYSIDLGACPGACCVHICLLDEEGFVFADAPMTKEMALKYGRLLTAIGTQASEHEGHKH